MAGGKASTLAIKITADAAGAKKGFTDAKGSADGLGKTMAGLGKKLIIGAGVLIGIQSLGQGLKTVYAEGRRTQDAVATTDMRIKSMGNAANVSVDHINKMSKSLAGMTGIQRTTIQESANLLLTFGNIKNAAGQGNDVFDRATKLALDMSVAFGQDAKSSAVMLGKALEDPTKGITALTRVGVSFTDAEKDKIKALVASGNAMEAQKMIMGALEKQVGGTAEGTANSMGKLKAKFEDIAGELGAKLLPYIDQFAQFLTDKVLPKVEEWATFFVDKLLPAMIDIGKTIVQLTQDFAPLIVAIGAIVAIVKIWTAVQAALNIVLLMNPIVLIIALIAGLVAGIVIAYQRCETFRNILNTVWNVIKTGISIYLTPMRLAFEGIKIAIGWVVDKVSDVVRVMKNIVVPGALDLIKGAFNGIKDAVQWVGDKVDWLIGLLGKIKMPSMPGWLDKILPGSAMPPTAFTLGSGAATRGAAAVPVHLAVSAPRVHVHLDSKLLRDVVTKTTVNAMRADGARYAAGGWA